MQHSRSQSSLRITASVMTLCFAGVISSSAFAQSDGIERPQLFNELVQCRSIADESQRLACYDLKVGEIDSAQKNKELIVADREAVDEAKRGVFGLKLPTIKLFGGNGDGDAITEVTQTVKSARKVGRGKWVLVLDDGAIWRQTDTKNLSRYPKEGSTIVIKRAAMGSYLGKVDNGSAFRIARVSE